MWAIQACHLTNGKAGYACVINEGLQNGNYHRFPQQVSSKGGLDPRRDADDEINQLKYAAANRVWMLMSISSPLWGSHQESNKNGGKEK